MDGLLAGFLAHLKDDGRSTFTIQTYRQNLRTFLAYCEHESILPVGATADELRVYLRRFGNDRTRRLHLAGLRRFYAHLRGQLEGFADPTRAAGPDGRLLLPLPRIRRRAPRVITDQEQDALFRAARTDLEARILLRLMRFSGLRVGAVVGYRRRMHDPYTQQTVRYLAPGVRITDIDMPRLQVRIRGKGADDEDNDDRKIAYMDGHTAALVGRLISTLAHQYPEAPLFQTPDGAPRGTRWAFGRFRDLVRAAGLERHLTLHMLRHTFLTRFLENGGDLRAAQRLAGHRDLETTLIYADYTKDAALRRQFDAYNLDQGDPDGASVERADPAHQERPQAAHEQEEQPDKQPPAQGTAEGGQSTVGH